MKKVENYKLKKIKKKLKPYTKMDKNIIKFDDTEIEEYKFHQNKSPILIIDIDVNKIIVSNKLRFGKQDFKYFIGDKDSLKNGPLCIFSPQMTIYKRNFDENRQI